MATIRELKEWLERYRDEDVVAYSLWMVADVEQVAAEEGVELTWQEKVKVLEWMDRKKDANVGLNWDIVRYWVEYVVNERDNDGKG